jgi:geranyl-CoA carboxylase alpha subunit
MAPVARFGTLLVANRGEIACRVIRTARALGLATVAVHSDADRHARHVALADRAVRIGPPAARDSYLGIDAVLEAARRSGAQAVHPGYGFLAENAAFARACRDAGLVFVGPPAEAIEALGNKSAAKRLAQRHAVPCLPGYEGADQSAATLVAEAHRIGAPLMIKAAAGGGGRGMRRIDDLDDEARLRESLESARTEALASFGNGDLLLERCVDDARHVEVQVFADAHGGCVHLGERDCSTQRRNQKILEEAPAPGVSPQLRARMGEAAVRLARAVGYVGAGTVEFLLGPDEAFWFLEVNTRLQVEHPVTEAITGVDLVEWQLRVAAGEPLPLAQEDIAWHGHAIEARWCAEDAFAGFAPQSGRILHWRMPAGAGVRVDHGLASRDAQVPPHYDSMIAKVIAHGATREQARVRLAAALERATVLGLRTNRDYLLAALRAAPFAQARLTTRWLEREAPGWHAPLPDTRWIAAAAAHRLVARARTHGPLALFSASGPRESPLRLAAAGRTHAVRLRYASGGSIVATVDAEPPIELSVTAAPPAVATGDAPGTPLADADGLAAAAELTVGAVHERVVGVITADGGWLDAFGVAAAYDDLTDRPPQRGSTGGGTVLAAMHGQVARVAVQPGDRVERGALLVAIEAMKMEHRIEAAVAGTVVEVGVSAGAQVAPGRLLAQIRADDLP